MHGISRAWNGLSGNVGRIQEPSPVLLLLAAFSCDEEALAWAQRQSTQAWGPVVLASARFDFVETDYYQRTMGSGLKKVFWAFEQRVDPADLADHKQQTSAWEKTYAKMVGGKSSLAAVDRPLNLDPGYLTEAKLVLASTKDHAHRVYLARGIYAEVTLRYQNHRWQAFDWTYPDYRRDDYHRFFLRCREVLRRGKVEGGTT